jgi:hypothetical protein
VAVSSSCFLPCQRAWRQTFFRDSWGEFTPAHFAQYALLLLLLLCCGTSAAQDIPSNAMEYQIKAAFLYKFCIYTEWPSAAFARSDSPFVFGVLGPENFIAELNAAVKGRTIGNRTVQIREINNENDLAGVHAIFLARSHQEFLPSLYAAASGMPLLVVTESEGSLADGATINFTLKNSRVSFEVALDNAQLQGLHLSAKMLEVASNVLLKAKP